VKSLPLVAERDDRHAEAQPHLYSIGDFAPPLCVDEAFTAGIARSRRLTPRQG
jgi:hypothetical protein